MLQNIRMLKFFKLQKKQDSGVAEANWSGVRRLDKEDTKSLPVLFNEIKTGGVLRTCISNQSVILL